MLPLLMLSLVSLLRPSSSYILSRVHLKAASAWRRPVSQSAFQNDVPVERHESASEYIDYGRPITVYIDPEIVKFLELSQYNRKIRLMLTKTLAVSDLTERKLRRHLENKVYELTGKEYVLRYSIPGSIPKRFETHEEVVNVFRSLQPLHLHIEGTPGRFPPPSYDYLVDMNDPAESEHFTMVSFYRFNQIDDPEGFSKTLFQLWKPFKAFGRVYVAKVGYGCVIYGVYI